MPAAASALCGEHHHYHQHDTTAAAAQQPALSLTCLPEALLLDVLARLGLQEACRTCALVNRRLLQATRSLTACSIAPVASMDRARLEGLQAWLSLQRNGGAVTSLQLSGAGFGQSVGCLQRLACAQNLRELKLCGLRVELQGALSAAASGLTQLQLAECFMPEGEAGLLALKHCSRLQHLSLAVLCTNGGEFVRLPPSLLSALPRSLTHLQLSGCTLTDASLAQLSCLRGLRECVLEPNFAVTSHAFAGLGQLQQLTWLSISGAVGARFSPETTPGLTMIGSLRRLELFGGSFAAPLLRGMRQLQHLVLSGVELAGERASSEAHSELLACVREMHALTHLGLESSLKHHPPAPAEEYAALTAPKQLAHLDVTFARLPAGVFEHLFPCGRRTCPALRVLKLYNACCERPLQQLPGGGAGGDVGVAAAAAGHHGPRLGGGDPQLRMSAADLSRLVECCAGLTELVLVKAMQPHHAAQDHSALSRLAALQTLHVDQMTDATAHVLARLGSLRELHLEGDAGATTDAGLLLLTSLRNLTTLYMSHGCPRSPLSARLGMVFIQNKVRVWCQACVHAR